MTTSAYTSQDDEYISLEEEWPEDPDQKLIFHNEYLDLYEIASANELEESYKRYMQNFYHLIEMAHDDLDMQFWVTHRYRFTHWTYIPKKSKNTC